jgi:hypothetical protein
VLHRFREWRIDRMTDRVARRPSSGKARETYGADDALVAFAREAGCREARIAHREAWAQLLLAQP